MHLSKIRERYTELVDFLKETLFQKGVLERPSYMELSKKLGFTYNWIKDKKDTLKTHSPMKKTFNDLFNRLSERYKDLLKDSWNTIENKFLNLYNSAFPTEPNLPSTAIIKKSVKRQFFDDIKDIIKNYFPNARIFDTLIKLEPNHKKEIEFLRKGFNYLKNLRDVYRLTVAANDSIDFDSLDANRKNLFRDFEKTRNGVYKTIKKLLKELS